MTARERLIEACSGLDGASLSDARLSDLVFDIVKVEPVRADSAVERVREDLWSAVTDPTVSDLVAYGALIGVTTIDRRQRNFGRFIQAMDEPAVVLRFRESDAFQMLSAERLLYVAVMGDETALLRARAQCLKYMDGFRGHHGAQNLLVEIDLALLARNPSDERVLQEALEANDESIRLSVGGNAKYFAHRALLRAFLGHETLAMADLQRAIDLEPSDRWDYSARIASYEATASRIQAISSRRELELKLSAAQDDIEGARGQLLTLTGLLAAVVAIVVINSGIATGSGSKADAISLILIGTGSVVLAFSLLIALVLPPRRNRVGFLIASLVVGAAMLAVGYFIPLQ